ncbi:MAG: tetratricopeptide repeat protein [Spartobacteria bacterium]
MKIRKFAAIIVLVLSSFAASNVAPSKAELEAMYDKAFREFDTNNFVEALKSLDAIDARQPDLAESQNLRGVILMREGIYDKAEGALQEALRIDPKFWNARFNLAEIPFLQKNWAEARKRFEDFLSNNVSELQGEAAQLIQYKVLLTFLLEGKENMVDSILAKFELSPDTPAVHYANAAIALQKKNTKEAKDWMTAAEKNFSPQLNKLFAESLYEVGWLEKQAGQSRAAIELTTATERAAKSAAFSRSRFEQAQQAFLQRDFATARKFIDEADAASPNQVATLNLRGEILMEQKEFDDAEATFKKALKVDPKFRQSQYNLAQLPFKKKDYAKARERFETLFSQTPGGDKNQAAQVIKFKIFMTLLLEGKESRAQKMMEQFQFTGDTPALYYAQAAWEFKHNNPNKATDWIASAKKIYSPSLNVVFSDSFYDLGWMQSPALAGSPAPGSEVAAVMSAQADSSPAIEPSPIPGTTVAPKTASKSDTAASSSSVIAGMEATSLRVNEAPAALGSAPAIALSESLAAGTPARPEDVPAAAAPELAPKVETSVDSAPPVASSAAVREREQPVQAQNKPATQKAQPAAATRSSLTAAASETPATVLAPARVRSVPRPGVMENLSRWIDTRSLIVAALVVAGLGLLAWVITPEIRRRGLSVPIYRSVAPATGPSIAPSSAVTAPVAAKSQLVGGPRQISLQLKASEPSLRRSVRPATKPGRSSFGSAAPVMTAPAVEPQIQTIVEPEVELPALIEPSFDSTVGPVIEQGEVFHFDPVVFQEPAFQEPIVQEAIISEVPAPVQWEEPIAAAEEIITAPMAEVVRQPEPAFETEFEPIGQGQPIPYQMPVSDFEVSTTEMTNAEADDTVRPASAELAAGAAIAGLGMLRQTVETPAFEVVSTEPSILQPTTPVIMPELVQTPNAPAPVIRTPTAGGAPQSQPASSTMHTAVELTFSFEIASMQLTPTFKMNALQLRPSSKVVTMRLAPSQQPQPAMNLQVTFEISKIQPTGGGLGTVRLTPSTQQRPQMTGSPSFTVGGLQLVSNFAAAPVQLTPSQSAGVLVTSSFQIATVEFSPSFEIASIVLNANSKRVSVQLPGAPAQEGAPTFEISNVQLGTSGDVGMMQVNLLGQEPSRA